MLGQYGYSRAMLPNVREIERRLRLLEKQLQRVGDSTSASAAEVAERVGAAIAPVLNRFRGGAHSMSDEAANLGNEVAKLGNDALRRLSNEIEHRPLVTLAVAVGVGILVGLASRSLAAGAPRAARRPPRRRAA
jgi:ElaB/YqjD/DUF883 family membrane-anchored ribosome-binding protein